MSAPPSQCPALDNTLASEATIKSEPSTCDSESEQVQVAASQSNAEQNLSFERRTYDEDIFIRVKDSGGHVSETRCSECAREGISKVYRGELRKSNVVRHWKAMHKVILVVPQIKHKPVVFKHAQNEATARRLMVQYHTVNNLALRHWDQDVTREVFQPYSDAFGVSVASEAMGSCILEEFDNVACEISRKLAKRMFSVRLDIASRKGRSLLGISAQIVDDLTFESEVITIGMVPLHQRHSSEYLKETILQCLNRYGLASHQVYSYTADSGANVLRTTRELLGDANSEVDEEEVDTEAMDLSELMHLFDGQIRSAAHLVQLAVDDFLKPNLVRWDRIREEVRKCRLFLKPDTSSTLPPLGNVKRWSSTYFMLKGLVAVKVQVDRHFSFEWDFIEGTLEALEPVAVLATKMQKEVYVMGDFFRDLLYCRIELGRVEERTVNRSAKQLRELLELRTEELLSSNAYAAAMIFDPRFNIEDSMAINDAQRETGIKFLMQKFKRLNRISRGSPAIEDYFAEDEEEEEEVPASPCTPLPRPSKRFKSVEEEISEMFCFAPKDIASLNGQGDDKLVAAMRSLRKGKKEGLTISCDVLAYWRERATYIDRDLAKLASLALAAPASHVTVERAFSILRDRNTRLDNDDFVEKYAIVKLNGNMFKPIIRD